MDNGNYSTEPMMVGKGVLQGDCLSPIILSMGYSYSKTLLPHQWFQFGNVLAITAPIEKDNHILLNVFTKCCNWAGLIISREKCSTFGFKKNDNSSTHLKVNNEVTAPIRLNETFTYLGETFSYIMSVEKVKSELISDFN